MQPTSPTIATHTEAVKSRARELGFDACGIAAADHIDPGDRLGAWLSRGFHATMKWMVTTRDIRQDPRKKLAGARSVVVLARNYYSPPAPESASRSGRVARYAWGRDYHRVLRRPLRELAAFIESLEPGTRCYASVDSGPVMERSWAERAGVGAIGKNSLVLRRDIGSWFFLATIITTLELEPDAPAADICGTCTLCIDSCPTAAIVEPGVVDSNRCISYHTIENRGEVPDSVASRQGDWVFGCDVCQDVCPWNRFARATTEPDFLPRPDQANPNLDELAALGESEFRARFSGTPLMRAKHAGIVRNARLVLGRMGGRKMKSW